MPSELSRQLERNRRRIHEHPTREEENRSKRQAGDGRGMESKGKRTKKREARITQHDQLNPQSEESKLHLELNPSKPFSSILSFF
jgi:hypothetical protein